MEEAVLQKKAQSSLLKDISTYLETHDLKFVADDAVFRNFASGETHRGKAEIGAMLHYMYHVAFDARAEVSAIMADGDRAIYEGTFKGRHIGEFQGIPATNKEVSVPMTVSYSLANGLIKEARIYFSPNNLLSQLGCTTPSASPKVTFLVRDIFHLKFGHYKDVKALMEEAFNNSLFPEGKSIRALTDFTGDSYRLIMEEGFDGLGQYEQSLTGGMATSEFQQWYKRFVPHVERSYREILRQVF